MRVRISKNDPATPDSREITAEGIEQVQRLAAKSVPSVNFRQVITSFTGVRSSVAGGDFIICKSDKVNNFIHVAAIDSPGLTACVAVAKRAVELLAAQGLALEEKEDWDGTRENTRTFREMSDEEKDAYIKQNPAYGKIVCRCETVTEAEILDAIHSPIPPCSVDGVKRRVRAGMGRCQGGFCAPRVMEILARELGIPETDVTKAGPGSELLVGRTKEA